MAVTGYMYKCKLTVDFTKLTGDVTDFPVLLTSTCLPAQIYNTGGTGALEGGGDAKFSSDAAGVNQLPCEIVSFVRATPAIEIWVKLNVSSASNTSFYVWWGKAGDTQPAVTNTYGRNAVWSNGFVAVWHMDSVTSIVDSTGTCANGTNYNVTVSASGKFGTGWLFNDAGDYITVPAPATGLRNQDLVTAAHAAGATWSWWVRPSEDWDTVTGRRHVVTKGKVDSGDHRQDWAHFLSDSAYDFVCEYHGTNWSVWDTAKTSWATNTWYHMALTVLPSDTTFAWYIDGASDNATSYTDVPVDYGDNPALSFGHHWTDEGQLAGILDECRISNISRAASWVAAEFANQNVPNTFTTAGSVIAVSRNIEHFVQHGLSRGIQRRIG